MPMKFMFTCGGTAGHVNPALAVAGRLRELLPDCEVLFLGAQGMMEMDLVPREGYEIRPLRITNIARGHDMAAIGHNLRTAGNVLSSLAESRRIIREFRPDVVIGTGGYVCYPVLTAAASLGVPTLVHESNALPGLTTRMLARHVDRILVGFEESRRHYPEPDKVLVTGTPVRGAFGSYTKETARRELGLDPSMPLVVSVWGSLGSGHMNKTMLALLPLLRGQKEFCMIHAIGSRDKAEFDKGVHALGLQPADCGVDAREYIYDMPRVMAAADLILCRAGASTLAELCYMGKPVVIVPSPNVTDNHQEKNARVLERAGGAKVLLEGEFDAESFLGTIRALLRDEEQLRGMSSAMASLSVPDATERIADVALSMAGK